ncbi:MAG TPA: hypothetical protein VKY92_18965 [Verrucomicrobiae bacterium]|jgi:hypothetical protein|nr:hypothetical protein [Verrucomicrobiae bacterium]
MSEWKLHVETELNRLTRYRCGLEAGQRVRLKKDLVVTRGDGIATGKVRRQGEEWVVLAGITTDPVLWFRQPGQPGGERCTWDDDLASMTEWFEILPIL